MSGQTNWIDRMLGYLNAGEPWIVSVRDCAEYHNAVMALRDELAAAIKERDEAHGLIREWRLNLVDVVEVGEYMDAMTSEARIAMNDADKRAFLSATVKEGGGA